MILVGLLLVVFGIAYIVSPWVREKFDGAKTYVLGALTVLSGILSGIGPVVEQTIQAIDPNLLATAFALDPRVKAGIMVALGIGIVWARMVSAKPGPLAKK